MATLQELIVAFETANATASDADNFHGNPQRWGVVRGIKAVAALEREACAKIADALAAICRDAQTLPESSLPGVEIHTALEAEHIAMLIRKRSNEH